MKGRITSTPSEEQFMASVRYALRVIAWNLDDEQKRAVKKRAGKSDDSQDGELVASFAPQSGIATCVFHVGFISIGETEEQLRRLRNEPVTCDFSPCRSRFINHSAAHYVFPIDATAARVAGGIDGR
jgi:hypothetical protein